MFSNLYVVDSNFNRIKRYNVNLKNLFSPFISKLNCRPLFSFDFISKAGFPLSRQRECPPSPLMVRVMTTFLFRYRQNRWRLPFAQTSHLTAKKTMIHQYKVVRLHLILKIFCISRYVQNIFYLQFTYSISMKAQ